MPDKVVQVPGVGNVSFPDSMADEDIATAIKSHMNAGPPAAPGIWDKANEYAGKALSAAGLPKSIADVPDWFKHLTGTHKDSQPFWEPVRNAIKNPTQENIVAAVPFVGPAAVSMSKDVRAGDYGGAAATLAGTVGGVTMAGQVEPGLQARATNAATKAGLPSNSSVPQTLYSSALKPSTTLTPAERASIVQTGLEKSIPVSEAGAQKLSGLVSDLTSKTKALIATDPTAPINKFSVASRLKDTANKFTTQVNPEADLNAVSEAGNEFLRNQPKDIPAATAQELKQGTYQQLGKKSYGELKSASIESQKALARGLKEELETQFPELKTLNAQQAKLFDLQPVLERAIGRIDNHQLIGIGTPVTAAAAKSVTGSGALATATAIMKAVVDNPQVKSWLAIKLNAAGKGSIPMAAAQAKVAAYSAALSQASPIEATQ